MLIGNFYVCEQVMLVATTMPVGNLFRRKITSMRHSYNLSTQQLEQYSQEYKKSNFITKGKLPGKYSIKSLCMSR